jgi:hypothetical protein
MVRLARLSLTAATFAALAACSFRISPNQGLFSCASDKDCGRGYQCIPQLNSPTGLCFPSGQCGPNQCCDVLRDGGDLLTDDANCGACGNACPSGTGCDGGVCRETNCEDGIDNDNNGLTDCADPNCPGRPCSNEDAGYICGLAWVPVADAGADAGLPDAGADAGPTDAGSADGGESDGGGVDGGLDAGGAADAGTDAGGFDGGFVQVPACVPPGG